MFSINQHVIVIDDEESTIPMATGLSEHGATLVEQLQSILNLSYVEATAVLERFNYDLERAIGHVLESRSSDQRSPAKPSKVPANDIGPALCPEWHACYQRLRQSGERYFTDDQFPPSSSSIDGRHRRSNATTVKCRCGLPAEARRVQSDGPNYGRFYLACGRRRPRKAAPPAASDSETTIQPVRYNPYAEVPTATSAPPPRFTNEKCDFFQWDPDGSQGAGYASSRLALLSWHHFGLENNCRLLTGGFAPGDIQQGAVGNCWFLSALAVVAEKSYLVRQLLPHNELNECGLYQVNLCLDGQWTPVLVDSHLPVVLPDSKRPNRKRKWTPVELAARGGVGADQGSVLPAFCTAPGRQLWSALVEKAYAKAHGSYAQLSGGFIAEGLSDLTGAPTETVVFDATIEMDEFWVRLQSFHQAGFLMGVATAQGGDGLVGGHAYSVLDVLEFRDCLVGEQTKVTDFFTTGPSSKVASSDDEVKVVQIPKSGPASERQTVRLVRIRNPWGKREWTGAWSSQSEQWTMALRKRLGSAAFAKNDGTFFMSYNDMLNRFHHMDVAKTRQGWVLSSADGIFRKTADAIDSSAHVYLLSVTKGSMAFISIVQPKKRSNTSSTYWYSDASFVVVKKPKEDGSEWTYVVAVAVGVKRSSHCQIFLDPQYEYACVPFSLVAANRTASDEHVFAFRLTVYSASKVELLAASHGLQIREAAVRHLHKALLRCEHKLLFPVSNRGLLACVQGDGCLYVLALNGNTDAHLTVKLNVSQANGVLVPLGTSGETYSVVPGSQSVLLVVCSNGTDSSCTEIDLSYLASEVIADKSSRRVHSGRLGIGSCVDLTMAGDLLLNDLDPARISDQGRHRIDTYLWIPQLGKASG